jgi:hypothetical protein
VRNILFASKEPDERSALVGDVVADGPTQHRKASLERIKNRSLRGRAQDLELDLAVGMSQRPQMERQNNANHILCLSSQHHRLIPPQ